MRMKVLLGQPRGFCAGVVRAVDIVELALKRYGAPVYVRHEIVHNKRVVEELRAKGAVFVDEVSDIPKGAITVFSAHGVSRKVVSDAGLRGLEVLDATCPLVARVHTEGQRYSIEGFEVVLIGHAGHAEVEGTLGQIDGAVHLVGSVPLSDSETVFKTLSSGVGRFFSRLPDGETGIRKSWIRFLQDVLAQHPAIEVAHDRIAGGV